MLPLPPLSPLFPYTTLFRSELDWWESHKLPNAELTVTAAPSQHFSGRGLRNRNSTLWSSFVDRKSTRLNSSHRCISSAVFCSKKKRRRRQHHRRRPHAARPC